MSLSWKLEYISIYSTCFLTKMLPNFIFKYIYGHEHVHANAGALGGFWISLTLYMGDYLNE